MFYSEGLQAGIALAVSEAKAVVCFVRGLSVIPARLFLHVNGCFGSLGLHANLVGLT